MEESFSTFLSERFPPNAKRSTSGVFRADFGRRIIQALRDPAAGDKNLRFFKKKTWIATARPPKSWCQRSFGGPCNEECHGIVCLWLL